MPWRDSISCSASSRPDAPKDLLLFDAALTDGLLRYARHLSQGKVMPESLSPQWLARRRPSTRDIPAELAQALKADRLKAYIESLHPKGQAYRNLRNALQRYEAISKSGGMANHIARPHLARGRQGPPGRCVDAPSCKQRGSGPAMHRRPITGMTRAWRLR